MVSSCVSEEAKITTKNLGDSQSQDSSGSESSLENSSGGGSDSGSCTLSGGMTASATVSGTLSWDNNKLDEKTLTITRSGSGFGLVNFSFAGDKSNYRITKLDGSSLPSHFDPSTGDYTIVLNDLNDSRTITFIPTYVDGTAATMNVTVKDGFGTTLSTLSATSLVQDTFYSQVMATADLIGLWSARDLDLGIKDDTEILLEDISGNNEGFIKGVIDPGPTGFEVDESGVFSSITLQNVLKTTSGGSSHYGIISKELSSGAVSGFIIGKFETSPSWFSWLDLGKYDGGSEGSAEFVVFQDGSNIGFNVNGGYGTATIGHSSIEDNSEYFFFGWRKSGSTTYTYLSEYGGSWKSAGESSSTYNYTNINGLRILYHGSAGPTRYIHAIGLFSSDITEAGLEDIFNAIH